MIWHPLNRPDEWKPRGSESEPDSLRPSSPPETVARWLAIIMIHKWDAPEAIQRLASARVGFAPLRLLQGAALQRWWWWWWWWQCVRDEWRSDGCSSSVFRLGSSLSPSGPLNGEGGKCCRADLTDLPETIVVHPAGFFVVRLFRCYIHHDDSQLFPAQKTTERRRRRLIR